MSTFYKFTYILVHQPVWHHAVYIHFSLHHLQTQNKLKSTNELCDGTDVLTFYCGLDSGMASPGLWPHRYPCLLRSEAITQQQPHSTSASSWLWHTLCMTCQITFVLGSYGLHMGRDDSENSHLFPWHSGRLTSVPKMHLMLLFDSLLLEYFLYLLASILFHFILCGSMLINRRIQAGSKYILAMTLTGP